MIKASDLVLNGFKISLDKGYEKVFTGHRLSITLSHKHIRIKMEGCSCVLVQTPHYTKEELTHLLIGLKSIS